MRPVKIIGVGQNVDDITLKQKKIIKSADILIGGSDQLKEFQYLNVEKIEIKNNLSIIVDTIHRKIDLKNIVVLGSGDPLYHGIGSYLIKQLGKEIFEISPNISSVAKAFSKINEPWQDAVLLSLHGQNPDNISKLFSHKKKFCLLTDEKKGPAWIAQQIIDINDEKFVMCVLEKLDSSEEKITWFDDLSEVAQSKFLNPNIVILFKQSCKPDSQKIKHIHTGMNDESFLHENGLITKSEIRSIVISKLNFVSDKHIFWDLGAGSGSVSIEASSIIKKGTVFAVEKNIERISLIKKNIASFNVSNIKVIHAKLPEGVEKMPIPDRIFIGGGGKNLSSILFKAINRLCINGIIVINTVLIQNLELVISLMRENGLNPKCVSIQISKLKSMPYSDRFKALNPVWIIYGKKES